MAGRTQTHAPQYGIVSTFEAEMLKVSLLLVEEYTFIDHSEKRTLDRSSLLDLQLDSYHKYKASIRLTSTFNNKFTFDRNDGIAGLVNKLNGFFEMRARDSIQNTHIPNLQAQISHLGHESRAEQSEGFSMHSVPQRSLYQLAYLVLELRCFLHRIFADQGSPPGDVCGDRDSENKSVLINETYTLRFYLCEEYLFKTIMSTLHDNNTLMHEIPLSKESEFDRIYTISCSTAISATVTATPIVDCDICSNFIEVKARRLQWACLTAYIIITLCSAAAQTYAEVWEVKWLKEIIGPTASIALLTLTSFLKINVSGWTFENMLRGVLTCDKLSGLPAWQPLNRWRSLRPCYSKAQWIRCIYKSVDEGLLSVGGIASCWVTQYYSPPAFNIDQAVTIRDLVLAGYSTMSQSTWNKDTSSFSFNTTHELIDPKGGTARLLLQRNGHYHCESWQSSGVYYSGDSYTRGSITLNTESVKLSLAATVGIDEGIEGYKKSVGHIRFELSKKGKVIEVMKDNQDIASNCEMKATAVPLKSKATQSLGRKTRETIGHTPVSKLKRGRNREETSKTRTNNDSGIVSEDAVAAKQVSGATTNALAEAESDNIVHSGGSRVGTTASVGMYAALMSKAVSDTTTGKLNDEKEADSNEDIAQQERSGSNVVDVEALAQPSGEGGEHQDGHIVVDTFVEVDTDNKKENVGVERPGAEKLCIGSPGQQYLSGENIAGFNKPFVTVSESRRDAMRMLKAQTHSKKPTVTFAEPAKAAENNYMIRGSKGLTLNKRPSIVKFDTGWVVDGGSLSKRADSFIMAEKGNHKISNVLSDVQLLPYTADLTINPPQVTKVKKNLRPVAIPAASPKLIKGTFIIEHQHYNASVLRSVMGFTKNDPGLENLLATGEHQMRQIRAVFGSKDGYGYTQRRIDKYM
ncbi:hypothetical protein GcC1_151006 [Golovinomyces cichoracearum]|uniref:Uncharacterized protein n=1 Tax=Golovinomyces cichoracearum TaxID=62708 RepID=A0A420HWV6_9PEZI|nr:hypothetical protein GcC1_151006 [Golovinomyces cichoracearum]